MGDRPVCSASYALLCEPSPRVLYTDTVLYTSTHCAVPRRAIVIVAPLRTHAHIRTALNCCCPSGPEPRRAPTTYLSPCLPPSRVREQPGMPARHRTPSLRMVDGAAACHGCWMAGWMVDGWLVAGGGTPRALGWYGQLHQATTVPLALLSEPSISAALHGPACWLGCETGSDLETDLCLMNSPTCLLCCCSNLSSYIAIANLPRCDLPRRSGSYQC
jgi:hypothetical protein